jgi:pimeloyl-ACP methyl ester carboxylesterase
VAHAHPGVQLHMLDFGGQGEVLLFLPGLGDTAHIFRGFAPRFTDRFRVLALTRRGHGESEQPAEGYELDALAADIAASLDALGIERAHLAGHSIAGAELTLFAARFPERVGKLVYLDAAYDRSTQEAVLEADPVPWLGAATPEDRASLQAWLAYTRRARVDLARYWTAAVEADVSASMEVQPDGAVKSRTPGRILGAIFASTAQGSPDYSRVSAPALALYALEDEAYRLPADADSAMRAALVRYQQDVSEPWQRASIEQFRAGARRGQVHLLEDTGHHLFLHRPDAVASMMRDFLLR